MKTAYEIMLALICLYILFMMYNNIREFFKNRSIDKSSYGLYIYNIDTVDVRILNLPHKKVLDILMSNFYKWDKEIVVHDPTLPEFQILKREPGMSYNDANCNSIENYLDHHLKLGTRIHVRNPKIKDFTLQVYKLER